MAEPAGMSEKDLRALQTEQAVQGLHTGARMLGRNVREVLFIGWGGRTAGGPSDAGTWLSVKHRPRQSQVSRHWHGLEDAYAIGEELQRPAFLHAISWVEDDLIYRVEEATLLKQTALSPHAHATVPLDLPDTWWSDLGGFLDILGHTRTNRVGLRQDLINRRIKERYGPDIDCEIEEWTIGHCDLHWGNLTQPPLAFFDWEGWGTAPRGSDVAMLLGYSLAMPALAEKVREAFAADLQSRSGQISQLFTCAELLRMIELYGDHPELRPFLEEEAKQLLTST